MERVERFRSAFNSLKSRGVFHTQKEAAQKMEYNESNFSSALKGSEAYLTDSFLKRFNDSFGGIFNEDWLLNGSGDMLSPSVSVKQINENGDNINGASITMAKDDEYKETLVLLQKTLGILTSQLAVKDEQIASLHRMIERLQK